MVICRVTLIVFVMTVGGKAVLFIKDTMEWESSSTRKSLQLLTMFMVFAVQFVTGDSLVVRTIFGP